MRNLVLTFLLLVLGCTCILAQRRTTRAPYRPCEQARTAPSSGNTPQFCGNNGNIYPNRHAFECAKLTNSRLRQISCNDSLILAKNALRNIQEQNRNGEITLSQKEKMKKMRERHQEQQRQREEERNRQG